MKTESIEKLRAIQERLRAGVAEVNAEAAQAEADKRGLEARRESVESRRGRVHPEAPEGAQRTADLAKLHLFEEWMGRRAERQAVVQAALFQILRHAAFAIRDACEIVSPMPWERYITPDRASDYAAQAIAEIENRINYVPPPPAPDPSETAGYYVGAPV